MTILFSCAFLCLVLESLGAPIGERKIGGRSYIVFVALAGILAAAYHLPFDLTALACTVLALMSLALANSVGYGDAYALILVAYALLLLLCRVHNY